MALQDWADGVLGSTPLTAARLNERDALLSAALLQLAADPSQLITGAIVLDPGGAPISASVVWPDGVTGVYSGTGSTAFDGAVDAYTVTRTGTPVKTFTQPSVTRDSRGNVTNRPAMTIS